MGKRIAIVCSLFFTMMFFSPRGLVGGSGRDTRIESLSGTIHKVGKGRIRNPKLLSRIILEECRKTAVDPLLVIALIQVESSFRTSVSSSKRAMGLMQLKPSTAREVAKILKWKTFSEEDLKDSIRNIKLGIYYLSKLKKQFKGNKIYFLTAYNNGPTRLRFLIRTSPSHEIMFHYAKKVLKIYESLRGEYPSIDLTM